MNAAANTLTVHTSGGYWPTQAQVHLLRAALLETRDALPAWRDWNRLQNLDCLDAGSFRLLGLLYRNLARIGVDPSSPKMPRLKGLYRHFWTRNQLTLQRKGELLRRLAERGIPSLLLKGAALTLAVYRDFGTRPMEDFDLMVPQDRVNDAMTLLEELGWTPEVHQSRELSRSIHACSFRNAAGARVDLHWRLCHLPASAEFNRTLWRDALPATIQDAPAAVPSFTDQFLLACAHGAHFQPIPPVRWLADAFLILREAGATLDWNRVADNAPDVGAVRGVRDTIEFLRRHLEVPVAPEALELMKKARIPLQERWENFFLDRPLGNPWRRLPLDISQFLRCTRGQDWPRRLAAFPEYFRHANNLTRGQFTTHVRGRIAYWFHHWLPYHFRRLPRLLFSADRGAIRDLPAGTLHNFHAIEPHRHRLFRWSLPQASLRLKFRPDAPCRITLDIGSLRGWETDLARHLRFTLAGDVIPTEAIRAKKGILKLPIVRFPPDADPWQILSWTCESLPAEGDCRSLGLPLFAARVSRIKTQLSQGQSPDSNSTAATPAFVKEEFTRRT